MLTTLIDEARETYHAAKDKADAKFDEYTLAPYDGKDEDRRGAFEDAWREMNHAHGVLEGLELAQRYLSAQERCSA